MTRARRTILNGFLFFPSLSEEKSYLVRMWDQLRSKDLVGEQQFHPNVRLANCVFAQMHERSNKGARTNTLERTHARAKEKEKKNYSRRALVTDWSTAKRLWETKTAALLGGKRGACALGYAPPPLPQLPQSPAGVNGKKGGREKRKRERERKTHGTIYIVDDVRRPHYTRRRKRSSGHLWNDSGDTIIVINIPIPTLNAFAYSKCVIKMGRNSDKMDHLLAIRNEDKVSFSNDVLLEDEDFDDCHMGKTRETWRG